MLLHNNYHSESSGIEKDERRVRKRKGVSKTCSDSNVNLRAMCCYAKTVLALWLTVAFKTDSAITTPGRTVFGSSPFRASVWRHTWTLAIVARIEALPRYVKGEEKELLQKAVSGYSMRHVHFILVGLNAANVIRFKPVLHTHKGQRGHEL